MLVIVNKDKMKSQSLSAKVQCGGLAVDDSMTTFEHLSKDLAYHLVQQKEHFVCNTTL